MRRPTRFRCRECKAVGPAADATARRLGR
ncbi:hypothetical protein C5Y97_22885 [Blastopirellula marina]|nr:hypothetical protein C5Y97_22885 [Blastopirellula marina]